MCIINYPFQYSIKRRLIRWTDQGRVSGDTKTRSCVLPVMPIWLSTNHFPPISTYMLFVSRWYLHGNGLLLDTVYTVPASSDFLDCINHYQNMNARQWQHVNASKENTQKFKWKYYGEVNTQSECALWAKVLKSSFPTCSWRFEFVT